jgi:hypothetical protein
MLKPVTLALALTFNAALADTECNIPLREGVLYHLSNPTEVELERVDESGKIAPVATAQPRSGNIFAALTLRLAARKSIGIYDYVLKPEDGTQEFKIIGMSIDGGPYQRVVWEARSSADEATVVWDGIYNTSKKSREGSKVFAPDTVIKLLFEVPANQAKRYKLESLLLDKVLQKEYGVKQVLDFDNMSNATSEEKIETVTEEAPQPGQ